MTANKPNNEVDSGQNKPGDSAPTDRTDQANQVSEAGMPKEIGGRDGPDPTRYGDWEKAGRCIDF